MRRGLTLEGWYFKREGKLVGPLPTEELRHLLAVGKIQPAAQVWGKWRRKDEVLFSPGAAADALDPPPRVDGLSPP